MTDRLDPDQALAADQEITSNNGSASLIMQGDGNLVLYEPISGGSRALWASDTWGNPGCSAIMQGDGNVVVYAPDWNPLWASNTYLQTQKVGFDPRQHGFHFSNRFVNRIATIPEFGTVETFGRCGGMAYAALDYHLANVPIPAYTSANYAPDGVPPDGNWLADYIYVRLMNSFFTPSALNFVAWTGHSDHQTWFYKGVTLWTK